MRALRVAGGSVTLVRLVHVELDALVVATMGAATARVRLLLEHLAARGTNPSDRRLHVRDAEPRVPRADGRILGEPERHLRVGDVRTAVTTRRRVLLGVAPPEHRAVERLGPVEVRSAEYVVADLLEEILGAERTPRRRTGGRV